MRTTLRGTLARFKKSKIRIIAVAGRRKAGKSVFVNYVIKTYPAFRHIRIADTPRAIARLLGLPADRKIYHALFGVNTLLFPIIKESAFKRRAAQILDAEKPSRAIVEAIRTKEEYQEFVAKRGGILVGIEAYPEIRFARVKEDGIRLNEKQDEARLSFQTFIGNHKKQTGEYQPSEREVGGIVKRAHFIIDNNHTTFSPFYKEIDTVMKALGVKKIKKRKQRK